MGGALAGPWARNSLERVGGAAERSPQSTMEPAIGNASTGMSVHRNRRYDGPTGTSGRSAKSKRCSIRGPARLLGWRSALRLSQVDVATN